MASGDFFEGWNAVYITTSLVVPIATGWFMKYKADRAHEIELKKLEKEEVARRAEAQNIANTSAFQMGEKIRDELRRDIERKEEKIKEFSKQLSELSKELKKAHDENNQLMLKFRALETTVMHRVEMLENAHFDLPIPQWIKDDSGRLLLINRVYEEVFLKPRGYTKDDYRYDSDVWPQEIAKAYRTNDMWVMINNSPWVGVEPVEGADGDVIEWRIAKYPLKSGIHVIGVIGIAFPESADDLFKHLSEAQVDKMEQMKP